MRVYRGRLHEDGSCVSCHNREEDIVIVIELDEVIVRVCSKCCKELIKGLGLAGK